MKPKGKHFGLIGDPIDHSLSPQLFAQAHPDSHDVYDLIQTPDFEKAYSIFLKRYDAINVTAPFKELAFEKANLHESSCSLIGAANLLVKKDGAVKAYNTDMEGVMRCLWRAVCSRIDSGIWSPGALRSREALVIGIGGAGKAAAVACLNLGFKTLIANRTRPRTFEFIDRISSFRRIIPEAVEFHDLSRAIANANIIVYSIPDSIPEIQSADLSNKIVLEANYREPSISSALIKETTLYLDGKEWLLEQAKATWRLL